MDLFCYDVLDIFGEPPPKLRRLSEKTPECVFISLEDIKSFFSLLEHRRIRKFLEFDKFFVYADKYLIAMVVTYFKRAGYSYQDYSAFNFFVALYLAHDMEEDDEDLKCTIIRWAFGTRWEIRHNELLNSRDKLWRLMNYRAVVSKKCCEEVMSMAPDHPIWERERSEKYSGARRDIWDNWYKDSPPKVEGSILSRLRPGFSVGNIGKHVLSITSNTIEKINSVSADCSEDIKRKGERECIPSGICVRLDNGIEITFHLKED